MAFSSIVARATAAFSLLFVTVALVAMVLISTGCGTSSKTPNKQETDRKPASSLNPNPGATLPAADPNDHRKLFIAFGDSLTAGYGVEPGKSYSDLLQKQIDADQKPWRVV